MRSFMALARAAGLGRRRGRVVGGATTIVVAALLGAVAVTPAPAAAAATEHCLLNAETQRLDCYGDFRAAMASATGGQVTDAPKDASALDARTIARITAAGDAAAASRAAGASSAANVVLSVLYDGTNYTGSTLSLTSSTTCAGGKVKNYSDWRDIGWNDRASSLRNINNCASFFYLNINQGGSYAIDHAHGGGRPTLPSSFDNQISSARLFEGPSAKQIVDLCGVPDNTCTFVNAQVTETDGDFREIMRRDNCSPFDGQQVVNWTDTTGGAITVGATVTATAEFSAGTLATVSASISASIGREWNWSNSVSSSTVVNLPGWSWASVERAPRLQHVKGQINVLTKDFQWGRKSWIVTNFEGVVEVANHLGHLRTRGDLMTDGEREQICGTGSSEPLPATVSVKSYNDLAG